MPSGIIVSGAEMVIAAVSASNRALFEVLWEQVDECVFVQKLRADAAVGAITFIHKITELPAQKCPIRPRQTVARRRGGEVGAVGSAPQPTLAKADVGRFEIDKYGVATCRYSDSYYGDPYFHGQRVGTSSAERTLGGTTMGTIPADGARSRPPNMSTASGARNRSQSNSAREDTPRNVWTAGSCSGNIPHMPAHGGVAPLSDMGMVGMVGGSHEDHTRGYATNTAGRTQVNGYNYEYMCEIDPFANSGGAATGAIAEVVATTIGIRDLDVVRDLTGYKLPIQLFERGLRPDQVRFRIFGTMIYWYTFCLLMIALKHDFLFLIVRLLPNAFISPHSPLPRSSAWSRRRRPSSTIASPASCTAPCSDSPCTRGKMSCRSYKEGVTPECEIVAQGCVWGGRSTETNKLG